MCSLSKEQSLLSRETIQNTFFFSSPEQEVLRSSYYDSVVSVVRRLLCLVNFLACVRSRDYIFSPIIMKLGQSVCLDEISHEFERAMSVKISITRSNLRKFLCTL